MSDGASKQVILRNRCERRFALLGVMVMLTGITVLAAILWFAVPEPPQDTLGPASDFPPAEEPYEVHANDHVYFIVNSGGTVLVLAPNAPGPNSNYSQCHIVWVPRRLQFVEPCYGSKFTLTGKWVEGPAPRGLDRFGYTVENGMLIVNRWQHVEGPPRS